MTPTSGARKPEASSSQVAQFMSRQRTRDTRPEVALRRALFVRGLRFRTHSGAVMGRPDVIFTRARIAVFVDGCFWHGCEAHFVAPKSNAAWWSAKLKRNKDRDEVVTKTLTREGWLVMRFWEHDSPDDAADKIERAWRERTGRPPR